ncbi:MAG: DUF4358 domain-containing protein, partial [Lachnospiraceae bacterium]
QGTGTGQTNGTNAGQTNGTNAGQTNGTNTGQTGTQNGTGGNQTNTGNGAYKEATMEELKAAVVEVLGENYWPNTAVEAQMLTEMYGITEDMYDEYFAETPMISTNVDTLIIIKAKEGQAEAVEKALNAYRDKLVADTMQYPMNVGKIQASRIEAIGNYVCFVQLGADVVDAMERGDEAVITKCQEENEKALDAIRTVLTKA